MGSIDYSIAIAYSINNYGSEKTMATSSFFKKFTLDSKRAVDSFVEILSNPVASVKIDKSCVSHESVKRGEEKLKKMLSR